MKYRVIKAYDDTPEDPIEIQQGEVLNFIEESDPAGDWPNWILCKRDNKEGWVPKQILKISGKTVTVLKDYIAKEHKLKLDEILIAEYELNGWIWCYKDDSSKSTGWAPLNCLKKI